MPQRKKNTDFAAGRLGRGTGRSRPGPEVSSYGGSRLGITPQQAPPPARREEDDDLVGSLTARQHADMRAALRRIAAEKADAGRAAREAAQAAADARHSPPAAARLAARAAALWQTRRPAVLIAAAAAALLVAVVTLLAVFGGEAASPQQASAARAPEARPAEPQAPPTPPPDPQEPPPRTPVVPPHPAKADANSFLENYRAPEIPAHLRRPAKSEPTSRPAGVPAEPEAASWDYIPCPPDLWLTGIAQGGDGLEANISGKFVSVGEIVREAKVIEIHPTFVIMERGGKRFTVRFGSQPGSAEHKPGEGDERGGPGTPEGKPPESPAGDGPSAQGGHVP